MVDAHQQDDNTQDLETVRVGYQAAIALWTYEGNLVWSKFSAMLITHTIVFAVAAQAVLQDKLVFPQKLVIVIVGFALCILWFLIMIRGFDQHDYWLLSARELEELYLSPLVQTVSRGRKVTRGQPVRLNIGGKITEYKWDGIYRRDRTRTVVYVLIAVFAGLYLALPFV